MRLTIPRLALLNRETQDVATFAEIDMAIDCQLFAQSFDGFTHGRQATVAVFTSEYRVGRWIISTEDVLSSLALDTITTNHSGMEGFRAVLELQVDFAVHLLHLNYPLPKVRDTRWQQLDHLIQELRPMRRRLSRRARQTMEQLPGPTLSRRVLAIAEVEPNVFARVPLVGSCAVVEAFLDGGIDEMHCASGIGSEGYTCADLAEVVGGLIDGDRHVMLQEADCEGEAGDAAADYGDVEGLGGGCGHCGKV